MKNEKINWQARLEQIVVHLLKGFVYILILGIILSCIHASFVQPAIDKAQCDRIEQNENYKEQLNAEKLFFLQTLDEQFTIVLDSFASVKNEVEQVSKCTEGLVENQEFIINNMITNEEVKGLLNNNLVYINPTPQPSLSRNLYEYNNK